MKKIKLFISGSDYFFLLDFLQDESVVLGRHGDVERHVVFLQQLATLALARRQVFLGQQQKNLAGDKPYKNNIVFTNRKLTAETFGQINKPGTAGSRQ